MPAYLLLLTTASTSQTAENSGAEVSRCSSRGSSAVSNTNLPGIQSTSDSQRSQRSEGELLLLRLLRLLGLLWLLQRGQQAGDEGLHADDHRVLHLSAPLLGDGGLGVDQLPLPAPDTSARPAASRWATETTARTGTGRSCGQCCGQLRRMSCSEKRRRLVQREARGRRGGGGEGGEEGQQVGDCSPAWSVADSADQCAAMRCSSRWRPKCWMTSLLTETETGRKTATARGRRGGMSLC